MPDPRKLDKPHPLKCRDHKSFNYLYRQVRKDFEDGVVWNKKCEKEQKWSLPIFNPDDKLSNKERNLKCEGHLVQLAATNIAGDIYDGVRDIKDLSKWQHGYLPRQHHSILENMLFPKKFMEKQVEYFLKQFRNYDDPMVSRENFLKYTERFFPAYFCECFTAELDNVEVKLVVVSPQEDQPASLVSVKGSENYEELASIDAVCNIATREGDCVELSRRNGVPVNFRMKDECDRKSLITLLCGYYRLTEKWTFSLSTEVSFPVIDNLTKNKVHGPIIEPYVVEKLKKTQFEKGSFLIRQCNSEHRRYYLHYCSREGCKPEHIIIREDPDNRQYELIPNDTQLLPEQLRLKYSSVSELVRAVRTIPSFLELGTAVHPNEFDKVEVLLLCRNDSQWRQDNLGGKMELGKEKIVINPKCLARYELTLSQGRMCSVWQGEWTTQGAVKRTVAIKQLHKSLKNSHQNQFMQMSDKALKWDDPSLVNVFGFCLPHMSEPPILVTEFFALGPLNLYLARNKALFQNVDLMEAAACLARALHYLSDNGIVHGEIRARNVFVSCHSESQFTVKLCDGSLDGPRREDVHWLDFAQLQSAVSSELFGPAEIIPSLEADVWSLGTTLWEVFSFGESPLADMSWREAAGKYLNGNRLKLPQLLVSGQLTQLGLIISDCWQPDISVRKSAQALMRDINQLLFRVFNTKRVQNYHTYVTIDPAPVTVTAPGYIRDGNTDDCARSLSSTSMDIPTPPVNCGRLVPMFNDISRKLLEHTSMHTNHFGSSSPLLLANSSSSRSGSIFDTDMSALTYQTSLTDTTNIYSISSIYQFDDASVEYSKEFPMGEGNFGVVFRGVRTKSDGDWEEVAIKEIKEEAQDDMESEVNLMKQLSHENIVKIIGVLTRGVNTIIVMEFIREGSLDRYLQINRHNIDYPKQLFGYAQNIADGMEYLTLNKIIHRDLAARNILVKDHETVKISDFGLARVATNDTYIMNSSSNIPVRWEAIECLTHRKYSQKSDVWSFGVTLWEMFSFGEIPALAGCEDFFSSPDRQREDFRVSIVVDDDQLS